MFFELKTRFEHITSFNAMKALGFVQTLKLRRIRLTSAKTSPSLRLNTFFRKTTLNALKLVISR